MNLTTVVFLTYIPITKSYVWLGYPENAWKKSTNSWVDSEFRFHRSKRKERRIHFLFPTSLRITNFSRFPSNQTKRNTIIFYVPNRRSSTCALANEVAHTLGGQSRSVPWMISSITYKTRKSPNWTSKLAEITITKTLERKQRKWCLKCLQWSESG